MDLFHGILRWHYYVEWQLLRHCLGLFSVKVGWRDNKGLRIIFPPSSLRVFWEWHVPFGHNLHLNKVGEKKSIKVDKQKWRLGDMCQSCQSKTIRQRKHSPPGLIPRWSPIMRSVHRSACKSTKLVFVFSLSLSLRFPGPPWRPSRSRTAVCSISLSLSLRYHTLSLSRSLAKPNRG